MNKYWADTDLNTSLVFISDGDSFQKFCYWNQKVGSNEIMISECKGEALGFLQVSHTVQILINFNECHDSNPRLAFDNFVKDCNSKILGFQSYSEYMCHIIDAMIEQIDENTSNDATGRQTVMGAVESTAIRRHISPDHICHQFDASSDIVIRDFHDQTKTRGFLAHTSMEFNFIGPDRAPPPTTTTLLDYIHMATVIQSTGLPNYKLARFPIQSGLNIQAWRHHLKGYYNKKLLEYLTYGFPLSLHIWLGGFKNFLCHIKNVLNTLYLVIHTILTCKINSKLEIPSCYSPPRLDLHLTLIGPPTVYSTDC